MAEISIIILTYNSVNFIIPCLDSILKPRVLGFEIILVDNASGDGTIPLVKKSYPEVKIIENKSNLGASSARNQALAIASGEWILTLDCDVVVEEGFLQVVLRIIAMAPLGVGMVAPKILDIKEGKIYSAGIRRLALNRFHDIGKGLSDAKRFNTPVSVFGACSASALYRRKMLEDVKDIHGYFDERFFFIFEDADLSWRAKKRGWDCMYYPGLRCFHHGNSSSTDKKTRQILSFRNRLMTVLKNQNPILILLVFPLYLVYDLPRFLILAAKFKCKFPKFNYFNS